MATNHEALNHSSDEPGSKPRSDTASTILDSVVTVSRPVYQTKAVRDKHLYEQNKEPVKEILKRKIKETVTCNQHKAKKIALGMFPFLGIMRKYKWRSDLLNDIMAGLTVGIMQLPQGMAYSLLADVPMYVGLYTSFFPVIVYFFFGTSKHVSMGSVAILALMTGGFVAAQGSQWRENNGLGPEGSDSNLTQEWLDKEMDFKVSIAATSALLVGLVQLGMGFLQVGFVTTYMGDSMISGFTTGAAVHVFTSQVKYILGIKIKRFPNLFQIINTYIAIFETITETNVASLIISLICIIILYIVKVYINIRYKPKMKMPVPIELIVVVAATLASYYGEFGDRWNVRVVGKIPRGLPAPTLPTFNNASEYVSDSIIIAIVAFAQTVSLAVLMARKYHYDIDSNKEVIGYGMGNLIGSFFSCMPFGASVSRTSVQDSAGGKTQLTSLVSACIVLMIIMFLGPLFEDLPNCVLSAIIVVALRSMFRQALQLKELIRVSPVDCAIWIVTFLAVVILHVDFGLVVGILFSLFTVVCRTQITKVKTLEYLQGVEEYKSSDLYSMTTSHSRISIVSYNSPLYYANSEIFLKHVHRETGVKPEKMRKALKKLMLLESPLQKNLKRAKADPKNVHINIVALQDEDHSSNGGPPHQKPNGGNEGTIDPWSTQDPRPFRYLVIDCSLISFIDPVGIKTFKQLIADYQAIGITTFFGGISDEVWSTLEKSDFVDQYESLLYLTTRDAVVAAQEFWRKDVEIISNNAMVTKF